MLKVIFCGSNVFFHHRFYMIRSLSYRIAPYHIL